MCVEARLSVLNVANLTSNRLIDRFCPWLPGCIMFNIVTLFKMTMFSRFYVMVCMFSRLYVMVCMFSQLYAMVGILLTVFSRLYVMVGILLTC